MTVFRPTDNPTSRGYSSTHKGYDFRGLNLPDAVRSAADGKIIERVDLYTTSWINNGPLTTKDYGNYIKVRHNDGTIALFAHLKKSSSFVVGTEVKAGQVIARIGNTGNSTGPHLHAEYRNTSNVNTPVNFVSGAPTAPTTPVSIPEGYELIKTIDLQRLRYTEEVFNDMCDYFGLDRATAGSGNMIKIVDDLKAIPNYAGDHAILLKIKDLLK